MRLGVTAAIMVLATPAFAQPGAEDRERGCDPYSQTHVSPRFGGGMELGLGRQHGASPLNHLAFLLGAVWNVRLTSSVALGGHADFLFGGGTGVDDDGDGVADVQFGDRRAFLATAGPRFRWAVGDSLTYLGVSVGAGYLAEIARGQSGAVLDATVAVGRGGGGRMSMGLRFLGGVGSARDTRALLLVGTLSSGGSPDMTVSGGCPGFESTPVVAYGLGLQTSLLGMLLNRDPGATLPGIAARLFFQVHSWVDLFVQTDLLAIKRPSRDPLTLLSIEGGVRVQHRAPISASVSAGYTRAHGTQPHDPGSGPTITGVVAYDFANSSREGFYLLVGSRFGVAASNRDLRVVWVGLRAEFRSDAYQR